MTARSDLAALIQRVEAAEGPDRELSEDVHIALGWRCRRVTGLGLNGRTPGGYRWFSPDDAIGAKGRSQTPCVSKPRVKARLAAALRARQAMEARDE